MNNKKIHQIFKITFILVLFSLQLQAENIRYSLVKIHFEGEIENYLKINNLEINYEDIISIEKSYIEAILDQKFLNILENKKIPYEIIINDLETYIEKNLNESAKTDYFLQDSTDFKFGSMSGYFTLGEIYDFFDFLSSKYPDLFSERFEIGSSIENRPIYCYKLGNLNNPDNPKILITALHHSREPLCLMTLAYFVQDILKNYESNNNKAQSILDKNLIYIIPVVNPDGYMFNQMRYPQGGGLWRKNRRKFNDSTFGVDLNRNYGPYEYWNSTNFGSSTDSTIETYRGKAPFSEPEIQAIKALCEQNKFVAALNLHSFGNMLLYPNSALSSETKDSALFRGISKYITEKNLFTFGRDLETVGYTSRGTSDDWMYLDLPDKNKIMAFTAEIGNPADLFWAPKSKIIPYCQKSLSLYYDFLGISYSNLVPIEIKNFIDFQSNEINLEFKFQNIGLRTIVNDCIIKLESLDDNLMVINPIRYSKKLNPAEFQIENFKILINKYDSQILKTFKLSIFNENYVLEDTVKLFIGRYDSLNIFENGKLEGNWNMGEWGLEFIEEFKEFVLSDSPKGYYKNSTENYLQLMTPVRIVSENTILEFTTKWSTESNRDACVVQISTDNGSTWIYLKTQRMIEGDGASRSKFVTGLYGLHGTFHYWVTQSVSLKDYYGKDILLRFGLLSDLSKNFDGWYLKNIKIKFYQNINSTESMPEIEKIKVYPNFINNNDKFIRIENLNLIECNLQVYDLLGNEYVLPKIIENSKLCYLNANQLNSGIYFIYIKNRERVRVFRFLVFD
ncbi:MAG: M14 family zinc carboxypeptidase [Candidatus Kapabacteria bacterium]|nr:M14 family zinc carboxypeptidase [Candidatus Kapabacteria bacterium]